MQTVTYVILDMSMHMSMQSTCNCERIHTTMASHIYCVGLKIGLSLQILGINNSLSTLSFYENLLQKLTIPANIMQKQDEELDHAIALSLLDDDHRQGTGKFALLVGSCAHVCFQVSIFDLSIELHCISKSLFTYTSLDMNLDGEGLFMQWCSKELGILNLRFFKIDLHNFKIQA